MGVLVWIGDALVVSALLLLKNGVPAKSRHNIVGLDLSVSNYMANELVDHHSTGPPTHF